MFGPYNLSTRQWFEGLAAKHPWMRENHLSGIVPPDVAQVLKDNDPAWVPAERIIEKADGVQREEIENAGTDDAFGNRLVGTGRRDGHSLEHRRSQEAQDENPRTRVTDKQTRGDREGEQGPDRGSPGKAHDSEQLRRNERTEMLQTVTLQHGGAIVADVQRDSFHELETGQTFEIVVDNEDAIKMKEAFDVQWAVVRLAALSGAAGVWALEPDSLDKDDSLGEMVTDWLEETASSMEL
ncbi:hypothetical protein Trisim1_001382 [Trichoderma cf. simile WF8]